VKTFVLSGIVGFPVDVTFVLIHWI